MTILFICILMIHGLIHLLGVLKAFSLAELPDLKLSIPKPTGYLWLTASLLLMVAALLLTMGIDWWWVSGLLAVTLSQGLVISAWRDAKYATIPNVIILVVSIIACGGWFFDRSVEREIDQIVSQQKPVQTGVILQQDIRQLPPPVKRWMENNGALGHKQISRVRLTQTGEMKIDPGQDAWIETTAEQYFNVERPSFIWSVNMQMMPLVYVTGRDLFYDGEGHMLIKLYSLFNVVDETGDKINRGTLQRFLSEIVWFPTAAINDYIIWSAVDSTTATATMSWHGISEAITFHFSGKGDIESVTADRYMGGGEDAVRRPWTVSILETGEFNGLRVPAEVEVSWQLDTGTFTWYRFTVTDIGYE